MRRWSSGVPRTASWCRKVAGPGVYIIGFTPESEVQRVVEYAVHQGRSRIAAMIGGQMKRWQNQTKTMNVNDCPKSVKVMFTLVTLR